jgi:hypothetical protein
MAATILLTILLLACVLSAVRRDDRDLDDRDRRGWWPGRR